MKAKDKCPSSKDFHVFQRKPDDKIPLQAFLRTEFQKQMAAITFTEIMFYMMDSCARISLLMRLCRNSNAHIQWQIPPCYYIWCSVLRSNGYIEATVLDTDNTDNYVQAAYVGQRTRDHVLETQTSANLRPLFVQ